MVAALITMLLSITGTVMWWQRRPQGTGGIGAPAMLPYAQNWRFPLVITAVLGLVFPLVGLSLIIVLLLDRFVLSHVPAIKRIFT